jgi:DNA-binding SARP family transcriptional activator/predicted ATPase
VRVDLLGGFRLLVAGRAPDRLPSSRQQQLLAYLVLHARRGPIPRQRVSGALWPDSTDDQALTNLRRELHHLREGWPAVDALIDAGSRALAWRGDGEGVVDLIAFEAAAERGTNGDTGALQSAAALYHGDLMPDCSGEWIDPDRDRLRQRAHDVLSRLVAVLEGDRAYGDAIERAQQLLRIDPLDEQAWCALMRCHARRGDRAAALHTYQQCAALLKKELGVQPSAATRIAYREILDLDVDAAAPPPPPRTSLYPLVGRRAEWDAVLVAWRATASAGARLCVIRGEAGIGKTRLGEELVDWLSLNRVSAASARCYAGEGRLAYAPIAEWLRSDALRPALAALDPAFTTDVARLHPELLAERPGVPAPDRQLESWQRVRFFEALAQAFRSASPLALLLDDVQWADGDTIDWLQYFVHSATAARCLIAATVRSGEEEDNPALGRLLRQIERDGRLTTIALGPLDRTATAQLAAEVAGRPLDESALARTFRETEGHPLFIVERGRMDLANGPDVPRDALPRVQAVVEARLATLSDDARSAAGIAAAIGRDFPFDVLAHASDLEEPALVRALDELWRRHIVRVQGDDRWDFSHDRIREVAYASIGPARRRLVHRRIAQAMEGLFSTRLDEVSGAIAAHLERGGQSARAIAFLDRAAAVATRVSANEEAIRCLTHALTLLENLPDGRDRAERELDLRSRLSIVLNSARGYAAPEVERNMDRVFALSVADGRGRVPVRWLWVAFTLRYMLGDLSAARDVAQQALARSAADPSCRCEAHHAMGGTLMTIGELEASRQHFDAALAAYDERHPQRSALGSDLGVFAHAWYSHALWLLGDEDAALASVDEAAALARRQDHKYSETLALAYAALLHQMRLDVPRAEAAAEAVVAMCDRYGFAYYGDWARLIIGWARGHDQPAEGVQAIEAALERLDRARAQARRPYYLSLLADTYGRRGDRNRAAAVLDAAIRMALDRGDMWWVPALYLQKSVMESPAERDIALQRALALAREQHSRALERRILGSPLLT